MMKELIFILKHQGNQLPLTHAPDGWDDMLIQYERSTKYWGVFRSYSVQLKFVKEGAEFIRDCFYLHRDPLVEVEIKRLNKTTWEYYTAYTAEIDFNTFKDELTSVAVNLVEGGLSALIKRNEEIEYTIEIENPGYWDCDGVSGYFANLEEVFISLIDKITGGGVSSGHYSAGSQILWDKRDSIVLTSRYNPATGNYYITTSLAQFFKSVNALWCLGMGIEVISGTETAVIKPISSFFSSNEIAYFPDATDFELSVNTQLRFNSIKAGYNDAKDNAYDANSFSVFSYPGQTVRQLDITSHYRADFSGLKDFDTDTHAVFFLHIVPKPQEPDRFTCKQGSIWKKNIGNPTPDFYNASISPRRIINNHIDLLEACINAPVTLGFTSGGNDNLNNETFQDGAQVSEYAPLQLLSTVNLFLPLYFTINVPLRSDYNQVMAVLNMGKVRFTWLGNDYSGYIMQAKVNLAGRGAVEMKLMPYHDTNLTTLIR